jgi:phosphomannomutase
VVLLGRSARFIPVDTEAVRPEDVVLAKQWSDEHGLDAILSTDGDSDRPLLADETGRWIGGDVLGILASRQLGATHVATPVTSNTALEATHWFEEISRTRIGSPFVIAEMQALLGEGRVVVGYEANGGLLLGSAVEDGARTLPALPTRDAVLPMVAALVASRGAGKSLGALVATLPARVTVSDRLTNFPVEISRRLLERLGAGVYSEAVSRSFGSFFDGISGDIVSVDQTDGLRATNVDGDILHIRPSGNAPELRCYVESETLDRAQYLSRAAMKRLTDWHASLTD